MSFSSYYLVEDQAGSEVQISPRFSVAQLTDAQWVAQSFSTMFQRRVRLVPVDGYPPFTLFSPSSCRVIPSASPPSITF